MEAKDFYFEISRGVSGTFFLITPKDYYDQEGCLSDESGVADAVVPAGFYELTESTYEFEGTPEQGRQLLLNAGMKEISFGLQPGEASVKRDEMEEGYEEDEFFDERREYDDLDELLYKNSEQPNPFDYKNVSTDKLLRHIQVMISTDSFEEAEKIKQELHSRGVTNF